MALIRTVCQRDCPDTCFVDVRVDAGKITSTRGSSGNPVTQGFLCPRGLGDPQRVYSERRVLDPRIRRNPSGDPGFERVGWEESLDRVAHKLAATLEEHGPESVLLYDYPGNQGFLAWQYPRRLWFALGATTTDYALCATSGHTGIRLHYGLSYGRQYEELIDSGVIIFWGHNAKVSAPHQWSLAARARSASQALIIAVDPRRSPTAEAADIHLQPRPGSDVALTYGLARHLILNQGLREEFIRDWTTGFEEYRAEALKWDPARVEKFTGLSPEAVADLGNILRDNPGAVFLIGLGLQKSAQGAEAARAISLLPALLGRHRGFHYGDAGGRFVDWDYLSGAAQAQVKGRVVSQVSLGSRLAAGEFKFVFVLGTNPVLTLPDQGAVREGLERDDVFVVVQDTHWSETTGWADVLLPAPTYLEKEDLNLSDHHLYSRLSERAVEPRGESRHEIWVMRELAKRLGLTDAQLFEDPWDALAQTLSGSYQGGDLQDIRAGATLKLRYREYGEYQTPSGKIEFASTKAAEMGAERLPCQTGLAHPAGWLTLLNSSIPRYTHSQFTDVHGPIPEVVWVNPEDAVDRSIPDGREVEVFNELGSVRLRAKVTEKVSPGTLWAARPLIGLNGAPLNVLAPGTAQKIGGGPVFNSIRVKVRPG